MTKRWVPSLADWLFVAILAITLLPAHGPTDLLSDGDVGWHIRTGDRILASGHVPDRDPFSYSRPGGRWFAWEWLADVLFALIHRWWGLTGIAALAGVLIAIPPALTYRRMLWEGSGTVVSLGVVLLAMGASTVHALARPHLFTYALLPAALWLLECDRRRPTRALWALAPLAALWVNLHAGFVALLVVLGLETAAAAWNDRARFRRLALLLAVCSAATLLNPYGWELHRHIAGYLNSSWIRDAVEEFQAPRFRSEGALHFLLLLFAGLIIVPRLWAERAWGKAGVLLFWAQASLQSARHIPIFSYLAAPLIASACRKQPAAAVPTNGNLPAAALGAVAVFLMMPQARFPEHRFPVAAVEQQQELLRNRRVLTSDQWADYLLYRLPGQKVFLDGRTDFYGQELARQYSHLMLLRPGWETALANHGFDAVLLPQEWPLGAVLRRDPGWRAVYSDRVASVLVREAPAARLSGSGGPAPPM